MGIEPTQPAWKAGALPLSYTRTTAIIAVPLPAPPSVPQLGPSVVEGVGFEPT